MSDALLAADLGASAIGFVFWKNSPRYIDPEKAKEISAALPPDVAPIGVFVDGSQQEIEQTAESVRLCAIQIHGKSSEFCIDLSKKVIKAVGLGGPESVADALQLPHEITILLDRFDPIKIGGTGQVIDWELASKVTGSRRVFLAGGLTPDNVKEAIRIAQPYAVDVSSGVESAPGIKDSTRLQDFFDAVKEAG